MSICSNSYSKIALNENIHSKWSKNLWKKKQPSKYCTFIAERGCWWGATSPVATKKTSRTSVRKRSEKSLILWSTVWSKNTPKSRSWSHRKKFNHTIKLDNISIILIDETSDGILIENIDESTSSLGLRLDVSLNDCQLVVELVDFLVLID